MPSEPLPPPPAASSETARRLLSTTRRTGTANELALRAALDALGVPYEVDAVPLPTQRRRRADLVIRSARIAVFSDGCFWHRCPQHFHPPKANAHWWALKLRDVRRRDRDTDFRLRVAGWLPLRFWEHVDHAAAARRVAQEVARRTSSPGTPAAPDAPAPGASGAGGERCTTTGPSVSSSPTASATCLRLPPGRTC